MRRRAAVIKYLLEIQRRLSPPLKGMGMGEAGASESVGGGGFQPSRFGNATSEH